MRCFQWAAAAAIALACAACSKETPKAPPAPTETASSAPITETRAPIPAAPEAALNATPPAPEPTPAAAPPAQPPQRVMTLIPAREHRIHALLNNAIARDVTGETEHDAAMWEQRRAACRTQACVDRAYAAQETALRKWEGSDAIR